MVKTSLRHDHKGDVKQPAAESIRTRAELMAENEKLQVKVDELEQELEKYRQLLRRSQKKIFGTSSEKISPDQLSFFNELEHGYDGSKDDDTVEHEVKTYRRRKKTNEEKYEHLVEDVVEHTLSGDDKACPVCEDELRDIGTKSYYEVYVRPAEVHVTKHVVHSYACKRCEANAERTPVKVAKGYQSFLPESTATPSFIAWVCDQRYNLNLPIYRLEKTINEQMGLSISRQTLYRWLMCTAEYYLKPVKALFQRELLQAPHLHADETRVQVLNEPGRKAKERSWIWLIRSGRGSPPIVTYHYQEHRDTASIRNLLRGFSGSLQADGYRSYEKLSGLELIGCFAHARRYFMEHLAGLPKAAKDEGSLAKDALSYITRLYAVERSIKDELTERKAEDASFTLEDELALIRKRRNEESRPIFDAYFTFLRQHEPQTFGSLLQAIQYSLGRERYLKAFLDNPYAEIDNNAAERAIKPFVIGRKNFLFFDTPSGAESSSIYYSLVITAKENKLNVYRYLMYLLENLKVLGDSPNEEDLRRLMPWSTELPPELHSSFQQ